MKSKRKLNGCSLRALLPTIILLLVVSTFMQCKPRNTTTDTDNLVFDSTAMDMVDSAMPPSNELPPPSKWDIFQRDEVGNDNSSSTSSSGESPDDAYENGHSAGYAQGYEDGEHGEDHGSGYYDGNDYTGYYADRYEDGYSEGYDQGYSEGKDEYENEMDYDD